MKLVLILAFYVIAQLSSFQTNGAKLKESDIDESWWALTIIHLNDMHARFDETDLNSNSCKPDAEDPCIGGYARIVTKIKEIKETKKDLHPIYVNAGDNFQGTLWYNIGRWNVTQQFLNMHPADVQTIGNHDFDHDIDGVVPYLEHTLNLTPTVISNVDDSDEPTFQQKYKKSHVITKYDRKIGVIGAILRTTDNIAKTGKLKFSDEANAVRQEAERLKNDEDVNIIVVLSHCGLDRDREIARNGGDIDIIVGGHSHSFLFSGDELPSLDRPAASYPVEVTQTGGRKVLIVQASAYTKYLGDITLYFDEDGIVQHFEGQPHFMGPAVVPDAEIVAALLPWKEVVDLEGQKVVGSIKFNAPQTNCYSGECLMGTLQAESMLAAAHDLPVDDDGWTYATMAFTNPGGVRGTLTAGELTYADLVTTTPFENYVEVLEIEGKYIREMLEHSVASSSNLFILQSAGIRVVFKQSNPVNQRVVLIEVLCRLCDVPRYEALVDDQWYRIVINGFLLENGDNYAMIRDNHRNKRVIDVDIDALTRYVENNSPITMINPKGRITFV